MDAFLSFGVGPRACLGTRFALMEVKIALVRLLAEFKIEVTKETPVSAIPSQDKLWYYQRGSVS